MLVTINTILNHLFNSQSHIPFFGTHPNQRRLKHLEKMYQSYISRALFAYPVAQEGAQDVDNQKEGEVADTLGQIGGRGKIGGNYIYRQEMKFIIPNVMRQIVLKYAGISHRSVKWKGK
jgi:hypothetical protein